MATDDNGRPRAEAAATSTPQATIPRLCACPRQCDWWLCGARPDLDSTPDGRACELAALIDTTGDDWWPGVFPAAVVTHG